MKKKIYFLKNDQILEYFPKSLPANPNICIEIQFIAS